MYFWWPEIGMWLISGDQKSISGHQNYTWAGQKWMCVFLVARNRHVANFWPPEINFWRPEFYLGWQDVDVCISGGQKWACCQSLANRQKLLATRILLRVARNGCLYFWWPEMGMLLISGHQKSNYGHHNSTWVEQE